MGRLAIDREHVANLTSQGWSAAKIAEMLKCSERHVVRIRHNLGIAKPSPNWLTPDEAIIAEQLLADGCSIAEIGRTLGRNENALYPRFRGRAWSRQQVSEYATMCRKLRDFR